jgi:hypothetical protein
MARQPVRVCANCGVGVAPQSSFRRSFHIETARGKRFTVIGHLCHGCRGRFRNDEEAGAFLHRELPAGLDPPAE